jgi:pimeloyl-ACP methyl ester carboxylesterase
MEVLVKSIPMYYEEYGTGYPIVMLHGWPTDHRHMVADMEPLFQARPGWRRIYPDLPGMGRTPGAAWITRQDHMLEVVVAFLQQVAPDQRYVVAGTSYGGYLARGLVHQQGAMMDGVLLMVPAVEPDHAKRNRHKCSSKTRNFWQRSHPPRLNSPISSSCRALNDSNPFGRLSNRPSRLRIMPFWND